MHTYRVRNVLGWAGAFLLFGSLATTAAARNNLHCTVVDETGKAIERGEMVLTAADTGREVKKERTNNQGQVRFRGLDDGSYQVRGNEDGYIFSASAPIALSGDVTKEDCNFTLISANHANQLLQEVLQLTQRKQLAEAEQKGKRLTEMMPEESGSHYVLAVAYATGGKKDEAVMEIEKAAELSPEKYQAMVKVVHLSAISVQADALVAKNDFDGAIGKYEEMIAVDPSEPITYYNMAVAYGRANKLNEALTAIDKAIALKPGDAEMQQMKVRLQDMFMKSLDTELKVQ